MKVLETKKQLLYFCLIVLSLLIFIFFYLGKMSFYFNNLNSYVWLLLGILALFLTFNDHQRVKGRAERIQTVFIIVTITLIIYFLSGLVVGYANTPYNTSLPGILRNLWLIIFVDIAKVYYRAAIIYFSKNKLWNYVFITLLFILVDTSIYAFINQSVDAISTFKNFFHILVPIIIKNSILTYLIINSGFLTALTYILPRALVSILVPIFPNYDWFLMAAKEMILAVVIIIAISQIDAKKVLKLSKRRLRKTRSKVFIPTIILIIMLTAFMAGLFSYVPLGIMSNSMWPEIKRGDVVIAHRMSVEEMHKLTKNDIIKFSRDRAYVVHRIISIEENDRGLWFQTKGDNNNAPDSDLVHEKQIFGKVVSKVPLIGYPTVWLSEYLNK